MKKTNIIPTIFSENKKEFEEKLKIILPITKKIQIDLMDGKFVEKKSVQPKYIPNLKEYDAEFEAHLMTLNPKKYFEKIKNKGFKKIIYHIETMKNEEEITEFSKQLRSQKIKPIIAITPETNIKKINLTKNNNYLLMGVHPGAEGQKLITNTYNKIKYIKKQNPKATIQIDGGVTPKNAMKLYLAGAKYLNSGSYISKNENPKQAIQTLIQRGKK